MAMAIIQKNKAYKFRLDPNEKQKELFAKTFGCTRFVYNHYLSLRTERYEKDKISLSYQDTAKNLPQLKKQYEFLKEVDSIALQQVLRHQEISFQNFFSKRANYPKYKSKKNRNCSYSTVCVNNNIRIEGNKLILPKLNKVRFKKHRDIPEGYVLKSVTVSKTPSNKYYASILFEYVEDIIPVVPLKVIGLDFSMPNLFVASESDIKVEEEFLHNYRKSLDKLAREQRKLSHCQKGSNRYEKQRLVIAKVHEHVANQRKDYLHKVSRKITNSYDAVCIEDLDMQALSQALNFGKSVADNGWGMFTRFLEYKLADEGKTLLKVDKWYPSSKTCHICGHVLEELPLSAREWTCPVCNTVHDRDINASINIKQESMRLLAIS